MLSKRDWYEEINRKLINEIEKSRIKSMSKNLMYDFVSEKRPNPIGGSCYECNYCYIHGTRGMKTRLPILKKKYNGSFRLYPKLLEKTYKENELIFFCDCIDWLHEKMPINIINTIIEWIKKSPNATFLSLTKNPARYFQILEETPSNVILGCTIESNSNYPAYSKAPPQIDRIRSMIELEENSDNKRFISIEPILKFNFNKFIPYIEAINPNYGIAIGYDNHNNRLYEPSLKDTLSLRHALIRYGFNVIDKTLKKAWWE